MEKKIRELRELIDRKQVLISKASTNDKAALNEELEDMQMALKLLEITKENTL